MKIGIVSDSTCDLPPDLVADLGIEVVPLYINVGGRGYLDGVDITREEFYRQLPDYLSHPTTGTPGAAAFLQVYQSLADGGAEAILSIHISRALSAVLDAAEMAARAFSRVPVVLRDSKQLSAGTGFQVELAARLSQEGQSMQAILAALDDLEQRTFVAAALNTLEFLKRSGRMNGVMAGLGSVLQVKPILTMEHGKPDSERVRTVSKAMSRLCELAAGFGRLERLVLLHSNAAERAADLRHDLRHLGITIDDQIVNITPVIGTHVGPGAVGYALIAAE